MRLGTAHALDVGVLFREELKEVRRDAVEAATRVELGRSRGK